MTDEVLQAIRKKYGNVDNMPNKAWRDLVIAVMGNSQIASIVDSLLDEELITGTAKLCIEPTHVLMRYRDLNNDHIDMVNRVALNWLSNVT